MADLVEIVVRPSQLLLDPNNPRLFDRPIERRELSAKDIQSDETQSKLLNELAKSKHALDDLIYSIKSQGFVNFDTLLVKPLEGTDKFLVLEGNRRTAAIQLLLRSDDVDQETKDSLRNLAVKELKLSAGEDEKEEIQRIISMRHLAGPRQWSPIARASAIYQNYMLQHRKLLGGPMTILTDRVMSRTSQVIGMPKSQLKHAMGVFALYQELADAGYPVRAEHFSLLELLVKNKKMASEYFSFNSAQLRTFDDGLEKVSDFFIDQNRIVNNPQEFNKINRIFNRGTTEELDLIRSGARTIENVLSDMAGRAKDSSFIDTINAVREKLEKLSVSSFRDSDADALAVMALKRLIDKKLLPLAASRLELEE